MALEAYRAKRNFRKTPEPGPKVGRGHRQPIFVIQEHHASHLHYDFRLEADGVLKSWAVPKEPSLDPSVKRLAVRVEDHPLSYAGFSGDIPEGQYGAGHVDIWDRGTYENLLEAKPTPQTVAEGIDAGRLEFVLHGERLQGRFALVRMRKGKGKENWLLIKMKDDFARPAAEQAPKAGAKPAANGATRRRVRAKRGAGRSTAGTVVLTHGDKVLFPDAGFTKEDVFNYYRGVAPRLLPFLRDRPVTLERLPEGLVAGAPHFWQKNTPAYYPDWIPRLDLETEAGKAVSYVLVNDRSTLLYLVNQGTLTFHVWASRADDLDKPDFVLFDIDPGKAGFDEAVAVAREVRSVLGDEGHKAYLKTSGKTGLHVLTPWDEGDYDEARAWALERANRVVEALPDRATTEISKAKRHGRVYIDVLQNARGHHAVPPFVLRALPGAPVSTPLEWRELKADLDPADFNLKTVPRRLERQKKDPFAAFRLSFAAAAVS